MEKRETKEVTEQKDLIIGYECDNCKKAITGVNQLPSNWHCFISSSYVLDGDDYTVHEVCSPACYIEKFISTVSSLIAFESAEIDEMGIAFAKSLVDHLKKIK